MNQPSALPPTRPTVAMSPILAMPTTSVENTSGAMIILISRRNAIGSSAVASAKPALDAGKYAVADVAGEDAEHQADDDVTGQAVGRHRESSRSISSERQASSSAPTARRYQANGVKRCVWM